MISIGETIRRWRKKQGPLSQKNLAGLLRVTARTIGNWERDLKLPRQDIIIDKLQVLIPELRGRKELRNGRVRLQESVKNEKGRSPEKTLFSTLWNFAYEHRDLSELKLGEDKVIFTLRLPGTKKEKPFVDEEVKEKVK